MPVIVKDGEQLFREYTKGEDGEIAVTNIAAVRFNVLTDEHAQRQNGRYQGRPVWSKPSSKSAPKTEMERAQRKMARMEIVTKIQKACYDEMLRVTAFTAVMHNVTQITAAQRMEMKMKMASLKVDNEALKVLSDHKDHANCVLSDQIQTHKDREGKLVAENNKLRDGLQARDLAICDLKDEIQRMKEEEKEQECDGVEDEEPMQRVLTMLNEEMETFQEHFNEDRVRGIYEDSPMELVQNESDFNRELDRYQQDVDRVVVAVKAFGKHIRDTQSLIDRISRPNVQEYRSWDLEQIMSWITALDGGKFQDHLGKLREGLVKSQILRGELLPELTRSDLSSPPFNIHEFVVKRDLEKHFRSLAVPDAVAENEGTDETSGAYIM